MTPTPALARGRCRRPARAAGRGRGAVGGGGDPVATKRRARGVRALRGRLPWGAAAVPPRCHPRFSPPCAFPRVAPFPSGSPGVWGRRSPLPLRVPPSGVALAARRAAAERRRAGGRWAARATISPSPRPPAPPYTCSAPLAPHRRRRWYPPSPRLLVPARGGRAAPGGAVCSPRTPRTPFFRRIPRGRGPLAPAFPPPVFAPAQTTLIDGTLRLLAKGNIGGEGGGGAGHNQTPTSAATPALAAAAADADGGDGVFPYSGSSGSPLPPGDGCHGDCAGCRRSLVAALAPALTRRCQ